VFDTAEQQARDTFGSEGVDANRLSFLRYGKFRYQNQEHTTEVLLKGAVTDAALEQIAEDFHNAYEREYTYRLEAPVEMVGIHLVARAEVGKLEMVAAKLEVNNATDAIKGSRKVDYALEGQHEATIYDGDKLTPGMHFTGPAIVEDAGTTIVIHPGNKVSIDAYRNVHILLESA